LIERDLYATGPGGSVTVTKFAYEDGNCIADLSSTLTVEYRRLYTGALDSLFARSDASGNIAWYLTDIIGSVRGITNSSGSLIDQEDYNAWGAKTYESSPSNGDRYTWASREWDGNISLYYNRARWFDPATLRWMSQDPMGFDAGDSNLYRYCNNQPTNATDPSGEIGGAGVYHLGEAWPFSSENVPQGGTQVAEKDRLIFKDATIADLDRDYSTTPFADLAKFALKRIKTEFDPHISNFETIKVPKTLDAVGKIKFQSPKAGTAPEGLLTFGFHLFFVRFDIKKNNDEVGIRVTEYIHTTRGDRPTKKETAIVTPKLGNAWTIATLKTPEGKNTASVIYVDCPGSVTPTKFLKGNIDGKGEDVVPLSYESSIIQVVELINKKTGKTIAHQTVYMNLKIEKNGELSSKFMSPSDDPRLQAFEDAVKKKLYPNSP
jgi:RHS repeat-associated protein